ncbi:MAG: SpoIIIAH-like family protein [Lachnospiraceae bacterium]
MKKIGRKNQIVIGVLSVMIAVAGYLNFSNRDMFVVNDQLELSEEETDIGEAVLADSDSVHDYVSKARLNREQSRAKTKEMLEEIVANEAIEDTQKEEAVETMVSLSGNIEKETAAEQMLGAKGFQDAVVSIGEESVDVVVNCAQLSKTEKAQIEDIVCRKAETSLDKIVITTIKSEK